MLANAKGIKKTVQLVGRNKSPVLFSSINKCGEFILCVTHFETIIANENLNADLWRQQINYPAVSP